MHSPPSRHLLAVIAVLVLLAHLSLFFAPWLIMRSLAAFLLLVFLPGWLAAWLIFSEELNGLERILLGLGLGYCFLIIGGLFLHYLPGPLSRPLLLGSCDLLLIALLISVFHRRRWEFLQVQRKWWHSMAPLLLILMVAAFFRLTWLGYSEFQDDEAKILLKATAVLQGQEDVLFLHKKGPAEVLITALVYGAGWRINEAAARLPFALAGLGGVAAIYLVGRELFGRTAGTWAALLIALNGNLIAFSRIVQYQNLVALLSTLVLLAAYRFWQGGSQARRYLFLAALFQACGLLAHYDAIFVAPAAILLGMVRLWQDSRTRRPMAIDFGWALIICLFPLLAFYLPFVLHSHFEMASGYLSNRLVGRRLPCNNLYELSMSATTYNAIYYLAPLVALLVLASVRQLARIRRGKARWLLPALFLTGLAMLLLRPGWWEWERTSGAGVFFALVFGLLLTARGSSLAWKAVLSWGACSFLFYTFILDDPRTHYYIFFPAAGLLAGAFLQEVEWRIRRWRWKAPVLTVMGLCLALSAFYLYATFVQHTFWYERTYPEHRIRLFWTPYGDDLPHQGLFGFPYRVGWKAVGWLYETGALRGDYNTNEEGEISHWYTRGAFRCATSPRYYFIAEYVQDEQYVDGQMLWDRYQLIGQISADGHPRLRIYERKPVLSRSLGNYRVEELIPTFDRQLSGPAFDTGFPLKEARERIACPRSLTLEGGIRFLGYTLEGLPAKPGEPLFLTLYWEASQPIAGDYIVFIHLEKEGKIWAQKDNSPCCGQKPTLEWKPGELVVDRYCLLVNPDTPTGDYPLFVGMYIPAEGRVPVFDKDGKPTGNTIELEPVSVVITERAF